MTAIDREAIRGLVTWLRDFTGPGSVGANEAADTLESLLALVPEPAGSPWCYAEDCRYWRSGSMPTHERGAHCPEPTPVSTDEGSR